MKTSLLFAAGIFAFLICCNRQPESREQIPAQGQPETVSIGFVTLNSFPHDTNSFTEGLFYHDGKLYESTGATKELPQTKSLYGIVDPVTGKINIKAELDGNEYFGEGIALLNNKIYQLTWRSKIGFIYDAATFKKTGEFILPVEEGWGLTTDGTNLVMSDGTNNLTFLEPGQLQPVKTISVSENGYATDYLNELEYVNGFIYANVWTTNKIVKINPQDGKVAGTIDLSPIAEDAKNSYPGSLEMNGIAYDPAENKFVITGKMWPRFYEIKIK